MMNRGQSRQRSSSTFALGKRTNLGDQVIAAMSGAMSRVFHAIRARTIIVGVNPATRLLANELDAIGNQVSIVNLKSEAERDHETMPFVYTVHPASADETVLTRARAQSARCLLAASADDDRNLRLCRIAIDKFRVPVVVAWLRLMDGLTSWARVDDTGISRMSWNNLIQALVPDMFLSPALSRLAKAEDREQIAEIEVRTPVHLGRKIAGLPLLDCEVVGLMRRNSPVTEFEDVELLMGDILSVIGTKVGLEKMSESFTTL